MGFGSAEDQHGAVDWAVKKTVSSTVYYLTWAIGVKFNERSIAGSVRLLLHVGPVFGFRSGAYQQDSKCVNRPIVTGGPGNGDGSGGWGGLGVGAGSGNGGPGNGDGSGGNGGSGVGVGPGDGLGESMVSSSCLQPSAVSKFS
jgi:hypothetical protein